MTSFLVFIAAVGLVASPLQDEVGPYEPFSVVYKVQMIPESAPAGALFLQELGEKEPFLPFVVASIKTNTSADKKERDYTFTLLPKSSGKFLFFPGILSFANNKDIIFQPTSIQVLKPASLVSMIEPLLPVNADQRLTLSEKNRQRSFYEDQNVEREREEALFTSRAQFANVISVFVLSILGALLLFWVGYEYQRGKGQKKKVVIPIDWTQELTALIQNNALAIPERFDKLAYIVSHIPSIDAALHATLAETRFSGRPLSEAEWLRFVQKAVQVAGKKP